MYAWMCYQPVSITYCQPVIIMGCIPSKNRIRQCQSPNQDRVAQPNEHSAVENRKSEAFGREDGGSTLATRSHNSLQSNMLKKTSSFSTNCSSLEASGVSTILQQLKGLVKADSSLAGVRIRQAWKPSHLEELACQQSSLPFYIQMVHGYPYENVTLTQSPSSTEPQFVALAVRQSVSIFLKFILQCPQCYQLTTATHCCSVFAFSSLNCTCSGSLASRSSGNPTINSAFVSVSLMKKQPSNLRIWSDDLQSFVFDGSLTKTQQINNSLARQQVITIKKESKLRAIGCTSCWSFLNLKQRASIKSTKHDKQNGPQIKMRFGSQRVMSCPCAICSKCQTTGAPSCQVCSS